MSLRLSHCILRTDWEELLKVITVITAIHLWKGTPALLLWAKDFLGKKVCDKIYDSKFNKKLKRQQDPWAPLCPAEFPPCFPPLPVGNLLLPSIKKEPTTSHSSSLLHSCPLAFSQDQCHEPNFAFAHGDLSVFKSPCLGQVTLTTFSRRIHKYAYDFKSYSSSPSAVIILWSEF